MSTSEQRCRFSTISNVSAGPFTVWCDCGWENVFQTEEAARAALEAHRAETTQSGDAS